MKTGTGNPFAAISVALVLLIGICTPVFAQPAGPAGAAPAATQAPPLPTVDAEADARAAAAAKAEEAEKACSKNTETLAAGKMAAVNALPAEQRKSLLRGQNAAAVAACLAVANDDADFCKLLPKETAAACVDQAKVAKELKGVPKEQLKFVIISRACRGNESKADCDKALEAMKSGDAAKCKSFAKVQMSAFCAALATGDATQCKPLTNGDERGVCVAYATNDPSKCPADAADCILLTKTFAKLAKDGLAGMQDIDPSLAAASQGKDACTPMLADMEKACNEASQAAHKQ
jgi:hypothetical protein